MVGLWSAHHKLPLALEPPANVLRHVDVSRAGKFRPSAEKGAATGSIHAIGRALNKEGQRIAMSVGFKMTVCSFTPSRIGIITSLRW